MEKKKKIIVPVALALLVLVVLASKYLSHNVDTPEQIKVSGTIEVIDTSLSFKVGGRVLQRLVSEGETITRGQSTALLEDSELQHEKELRQAAVEAAKATLAELMSGSRPDEINEAQAVTLRARAVLAELNAGSRPQEIKTAQAQVQQANAVFERWQAEYTRQKQLLEREVIAPREFEQVKSQYLSAMEQQRVADERVQLVSAGPRQEQIDQAKASLAQAEARLALVTKGPRQETIDRAKAQVREAEEALAMATTRLGYATLSAPTAGVVLSDHVEVGEYVSPGSPVVTIAALENVWLRAYIAETDLGRIKIGQQVEVASDTYPDKKYLGTISFISASAEFTPKNVQTERERVKLVYRIKVDIPNPDLELKPGMPVDGEIRISQSR
ncbi:MAG: HlyD family efflux transporter periplasmic adaptor subunit [Proteobacteria bacterium]|nr:HlyD family efflux transporter periplasmic adaptor subunit [Desulfobulbaceae bacterium]MBU4151490.1 HlyD family efflux transporter periplasmic adaptor subunit [Pseudomonadota bacterium]MDP2106600.1 HlyD family efflux transporter periplasmic adaptor subunit [Desulfobulbaceae bacterium]